MKNWDKVLLIPVSITYDNSTSSSGNKTITGIQNDLKPGYAKLKGGPKENAKGEVESPLKDRSYIHQFQQVTDRYSIKSFRSTMSGRLFYD